MLVVALGHKGGQHFIYAVDCSAAINMAGDLGDDLRGNCSGSRDGFWRFNLGIAHLEPLGQHATEIDQHTVEHRKKGE